MKTYTTEINEYQRLLFVRALEYLIEKQPDVLQNLEGDNSTMIPNDNMLQEAQLLQELLEELPQNKEAAPEDIQSLCH